MILNISLLTDRPDLKQDQFRYGPSRLQKSTRQFCQVDRILLFFDDFYVGAGDRDGDDAAVFEFGFEDADHSFGSALLQLFREVGHGAEDAPN